MDIEIKINLSNSRAGFTRSSSIIFIKKVKKAIELKAMGLFQRSKLQESHELFETNYVNKPDAKYQSLNQKNEIIA